MFPLKDNIPARSFPLVTVALVLLNAAAFAYQLSLEAGGADGSRAARELITEFGLVPCRLRGTCPDAAAGLPSPYTTVFTSMFLHGGVFHLGGNMLYLWIFGKSVEDTFGHGRFVTFYLLSGVAAALAQTAVQPSSAVPMIGASGAVSGVLGAYLLLFPQARVLTLVIIGFLVRLVHIPAVIVLGFWIVVQFLNGIVTFGVTAARGSPAGGVAWFAHVGGFLAGMALLPLLRPQRSRRAW